MGQLRYGDSTVLDIDDATLAHFQVVILGKLRVHESLVVAWTDTDTGLRSTLWIHPQTQLAFLYTELDLPQIDSARLRDLRAHADETGTLRLPRSARPEADMRAEGSAGLVMKRQGASGRP